MKYRVKLLAFLFTIVVTVSALANDNNVAKVVIMRGMVKAKLTDGTIIDVKADQSIPEGAIVQTAEKSFVKLLFIDKSQMNLGPNSQMVINAFPKKEAGIITLVKGQIRSQVTKDYMEMEDKSKSKLYIKTKTAAMGIRGTDFQVNYNPQNQNTALITFEGKVAMAHIDRDMRDRKFDQGNLENVVSSDKAVLVTKGQISAVNLNVAERAMLPTKLGIKQIDALEQNETGLKEGSSNSEKQFRSPIPPGAEGTAFSNSNDNLDKEVAKMGVDIKTTLPAVSHSEKTGGGADGFFNTTTGEYKLPAGSIVDLNTVNIIPPPTNALFDNNSGTYIVPETLGKVDKVTGEYKAPAGLVLDPSGKFIVVDPEAFKKAQAPAKEEEKSSASPSDSETKTEEKKDSAEVAKAEGEPGRAPASVPPSDVKAPELFAGEAKNFIATHAAPVVPPPAGPPPVNRGALTGIAADVLQKNDVSKQTASDRGVIAPNTKVKFIFNAE